MAKPRKSSRGKGSGAKAKQPSAEPRATAREVGDALGITPAMVGKLRNQGMPSVKDGRRYFYDPDECRKWYAANRIESGKGGPRPNSGRKPKQWVDDDPGPSPKAKPAKTTGKQEQLTTPAAVKAAADSVQGELDPSDLERLTSAELQQKKLIEEVLMLRLKRNQEEGRLIDVDDARSSISRATSSLSRSLRQVGKSIAGIVIDTVGADPTQTDAVRQLIDEQIDQALGELATAMTKGVS